MGNGFPIGGILIHPQIKASYGLLGTTFGGNHLACTAVSTVLDIIEKEQLMDNAKAVSAHFLKRAQELPQVKNVKGRGLMLGLEFDFPIATIRKNILFNHHILLVVQKILT